MDALNPALLPGAKTVNLYSCQFHEDISLSFPNMPTTEQGGCCALHSTPCYSCPCDWGLVCQFFIAGDRITTLDADNQPIAAGTVIRQFLRRAGYARTVDETDKSLSALFSMNYELAERNALIAKIRAHLNIQLPIRA